MKIHKRERVSAFTHGFTIPIMLIGLIILIIMSLGNIPALFVSIIYGLSAIFLFSASFLYHSKKKSDTDKSFLRKLDHFAIFFLIAGTYTPISYLYLEGNMRLGILIAQWSLVILGIFFKFFFINAPRVICTIIYLLMGWMAIIPISSLIDVMPHIEFIYLAFGGVFYTIGALIYAVKRPNPVPNYFGFHEIFHIFIIGGAISHLLMVIYGINHFINSVAL
jgi:hemolysin III